MSLQNHFKDGNDFILVLFANYLHSLISINSLLDFGNSMINNSMVVEFKLSLNQSKYVQNIRMPISTATSL